MVILVTIGEIFGKRLGTSEEISLMSFDFVFRSSIELNRT